MALVFSLHGDFVWPPAPKSGSVATRRGCRGNSLSDHSRCRVALDRHVAMASGGPPQRFAPPLPSTKSTPWMTHRNGLRTVKVRKPASGSIPDLKRTVAGASCSAAGFSSRNASRT